MRIFSDFEVSPFFFAFTQSFLRSMDSSQNSKVLKLIRAFNPEASAGKVFVQSLSTESRACLHGSASVIASASPWKLVSRDRQQKVHPLRLCQRKSSQRKSSKMLIRRKILPRTANDILSTTFLLIIVPLIYWFELWVVLPNLYEPGSAIYIFHFCLGSFIMINIVGNFTYTVLCDTSIRQVVVPTSKANVKEGWRLCTVCETVAPPRSWHCTTCDMCILKRDHHCIFTACCVGHYNHRYFLMFIFYLFAATMYSFAYNNYFIWSRIEFEFPITIVKLVFPVAIFMFGFDGSMEQFYLMLYIVTVIGMLFTGALCFYHFNLVLNGCTSNERNKKNYNYSLGWKQNIKEVFGDKWYLVWLIPYVPSKLPQDGVSWRRSSKWNMNNSKGK